MQTFEEAVDEKLTPLHEAMQAFSGAHSRQEHRRTLAQLDTALTAAEGFAERNQHIEARIALQFRDTVQSARRIFNHHHEKLRSLPAPAPEITSMPSAPPSKPQPPAHALVLTREQARDVPTYRRAKTQAAAEGKTLWIEPM
jgi:hypothetical protein